MQKFVELKKGVDLQNEWFKKCQNEQVPYIVVDKSNKYATVRWDYISFYMHKDSLIKKNQDKYLPEIMHIYRHYSNDKSTYQISGGLIDFEKIENEKANDLASDLYDVAAKIYEIS